MQEHDIAENQEEKIDEAEATPAEDDHAYGLNDAVIRAIAPLIEAEASNEALALLRELEPVDIAELIEKSSADLRGKILDLMDRKIHPEAYTHIDHELATSILSQMRPKQVSFIINHLESDDALDLVRDLDEEFKDEILKTLSRRLRIIVEEGLTFPEDSAGRLMQREMVSIPQFWTVGKAVDYLRSASETLPSDFYDIFVIDPLYHFVGKLPISKILRSERDVQIIDLLNEDSGYSVPAEMDQEEVTFLFRRHALISAPVVDENNRLIGMITVDDIVDVIDEEAEEDMLKMGGVANDDIYRAALSTAKSRFSWLAINLLTAIAASLVIGLFEATIQEVVALAVLMPIVASMGGNAGTQTLTVAVRALATKDLSSANAYQIVGKEFLVGVINGLLFAIIMGLIAWLWFDHLMLGAVIAAAMVFNLMVAGFAGVIIPLTLHKFDMDPALSSAVFLTTITDILGFFAFLGMAAWLLL